MSDTQHREYKVTPEQAAEVWKALKAKYGDMALIEERGPELECPICGQVSESWRAATAWDDAGNVIEWTAPHGECSWCEAELIKPYDIVYAYPLAEMGDE